MAQFIKVIREPTVRLRSRVRVIIVNHGRWNVGTRDCCGATRYVDAALVWRLLPILLFQRRYVREHGCAERPIFVPSFFDRKWSLFLESTYSTTQIQHTHLSDFSGDDHL